MGGNWQDLDRTRPRGQDGHEGERQRDSRHDARKAKRHREHDNERDGGHAREREDGGRERENPPKTGEAQRTRTPLCQGCGHYHKGTKDECRHKELEGWNASSKSWADSDTGKAFREKNIFSLPINKSAEANKKARKEKSNKGEISKLIPSDTYPLTVLFDDRKQVTLSVKLDSGASTRNYVHPDVAEEAERHGAVIRSCSDCPVIQNTQRGRKYKV